MKTCFTSKQYIILLAVMGGGIGRFFKSNTRSSFFGYKKYFALNTQF